MEAPGTFQGVGLLQAASRKSNSYFASLSVIRQFFISTLSLPLVSRSALFAPCQIKKTKLRCRFPPTAFVKTLGEVGGRSKELSLWHQVLSFFVPYEPQKQRALSSQCLALESDTLILSSHVWSGECVAHVHGPLTRSFSDPLFHLSALSGWDRAGGTISFRRKGGS